jgi:hypothetical protein
MMNINWPIIRAKLKEAILVLPHFFKNPVQGMRMLPEWDWPTLLILQAAFAAACSVVQNILERDIIGMFTGLIIAPLAHILMIAIGSGFFFYTFMFFFKREIPFRQIYIHLVFASIPVQIVMIVAGLVPPIVLLGAAGTFLLMYIAFVDVFQMERQKTKKMLIGLMALYTIFWATQLVTYTSKHKTLRQKATPESLDILEKELGFGGDD